MSKKQKLRSQQHDLLIPFSFLMIFFRAIKMEKIAWALRRIYCPVKKTALVLEVGSGGNPYSRSNVLLDAYEHTRERHWASLVKDRPTVLGFVENLPFKDKVFDFVIASHVLEHSSDPQKFLSELQRVANAGYIEVPDAFMERINPYKDHKLEITLREGKLIIFKKSKMVVDDYLVDLYEAHAKKYIASKLIPSHPFSFHVRYFWSKKLNFEVINPEVDCSWVDLPEGAQSSIQNNENKTLRSLLTNLSRMLLSQGSRNKKIDLLDFLRCPNCFSETLIEKECDYLCSKCKNRYPISNGIPKMLVS